MWSQVTIFWETVGGIWETVFIPQNNLKKKHCLHPSWKVHTWIEICASLNHRKKTKADGSRLIPRKHTETLVLLSGVLVICRSWEFLTLIQFADKDALSLVDARFATLYHVNVCTTPGRFKKVCCSFTSKLTFGLNASRTNLDTTLFSFKQREKCSNLSCRQCDAKPRKESPKLLSSLHATGKLRFQASFC